MSQPNTSSTRSTGSPLLKTLRRRAKLPMTAILVASLTAWTLPANGASLVWVGGSGTWDNTIANWTPGSVAWVNGTDTAVFNGGSGTVTLGVPITAGGLTFNNSDYTIAGGGNVLTLGLPAGTPSPLIAVNNTAGTFPARTVISAQLAGSNGFTKTGNGTLLLSNNANSISGDVSIKQGALIITNGSQLGTGTTAISVTGVANSGNPGYSGGSLVLQGVGSSASATGMTLNREVSISGRGPTAVNNTGGVVSIGYNNLAGGLTIGSAVSESRVWATHGTTTVSGTLNLGTGGSQIFQGNGNWNISGVVTGVENSADRLIKSGTVVSTTMWLQNAANNYANTLRIDSGTVRVQTNGALGISTSNQAVDLQNATLEVRTDAGAGFLTRNVTQRDNTSGGIFVDHDITGPLGIGTSLINQTVTFGRLGRTTGTNTATFSISGRNGYNTSFATLFGAAANGPLVFNNNSNGLVTYTGDVSITNDTTARAFTVGGSAETLITGGILASGAAHTLVKSGTGTLSVQGIASNYTGATTVQQGTLSVNQAGALGNNTTNLNLGSGASTGTLNYLGASGTGAGETITKPVNLNGGTGSATILANQAGSSPSPLIFNGTFTTATTAKTLTLGGNSTQLNEIQSAIPNPASGNLTLVKNGPGTWVLSGTNAYLGATTITNGTLRLKDTFSGASQNVVQNASAITFAATTFNYAAGGTLEYLGANNAASTEAVGALTPQAGLGIVKTTAQGTGSATLNFASYAARTAGTAVNFQPGTGTGIQFAAVPTAVLNGLVSGAYITNPGTGEIDFVATPAINANIAALNAATALPATGGVATTNYLLNADLTTTGALAANSIRITNGADLTLGAALTVTSTSANALGAILHDNAGGASIISGSSITSSTTNQELLIITGGTTPANSLTISSALANGTGVVTKAGNGTLVLSGVNTFTGALNILSGTLQASGTSASILGIPAAGTIHTLRQGATLDLNGAGASTAPYASATPIPVLISAIMQGAGNITSTAAGAQAIQFGVAASTAATGVVSGVISDGAGTVSVIKQGAAASVQALIGLNTYTGPTVITGGILQANTLANGGQPSSIGASSNAAANLVFNGGILLYQGSNATVFQATQSPSVSTDRLFTLAGAGTIESTGSYGNNVTGTPAGNNAALIFSNTGAVAYDAPNVARSLTLQGGSSGDNEMRINLVDNGSGALSLTKAGGGLWILNPAAANTYTGATTVSGGALRAIDGQGLSAGSLLTLNGGVLETSGTFTRALGAAAGQVQLTGGTSGFAAATADRLVVTLGGGTITWGGTTFNPTALVLGSSTALGETEFTNNLDLGAAARTVTVNNNANTGLAVTTGILSGVLSGTGGALVKSGAGMLVLGNANTYTGNTTVASSANGQGGLVVTSIGNSTGTVSSSLGASGGIFIMNPADSDSNALVYVGSGETASRAFTMTSSANQTANRVYRLESSGSGALVLNGAFSNTVTRNASGQTVVLELRGTNTDANQMNMTLANSTGTNTPSLSVQKADGGVWVLNPASANTFTGNITAAGGLLGLTANGIGAAGSIVLSNGGVFAYGGALTTTKPFTHANNTTAIFAGTNAITINANYTLAAGNNAMTFSNNLENGALLTFNGNLVNLKANNQTMNIRGYGSTLWNGALQDATANTTAINIAIANDASFTTTGAAANTYTGAISLLQGTFVADKATAFGAASSAGAVNLNGAVVTVGPNISDITVTNTSVALGGDPARFTGSKNITFTGNGSIGGADRVIQNELSGGALLTFSGASMTVNSSSAGRTLVHQGTGNTTISGVLQNNATNAAALLSLNQRGNNTLTLTGDSIMTGSVTVSAGTLALSGSGRLASASSYTVFNGGTLTLDNAVTNNADRLGNAIAITLNGGALNFISNAASTAETVGALTLGGGGSGIAISGAGAANSLTFTSATFGVGSSLNVTSAALGGADKILFTTAPVLTPASTGILPRVTVNGADFANYAAGTGVSAFTAYNTAADINTAAATDTFKITGATTTSSLTGNLTLNALAFDGAGLTAGGSPATNLTLNSGGVLVKGGASTLSVPTVILGAEGLFHVASGSSLSVSSSLQGILGVTKTLGGSLTFTTPQTYLGATTINGGTLVLAGGNNTLLGSQPMAVNLGGTVDLNGNSQYIGSLSSAGNQPGTGGVITNTGTASTLTLNQTVAATFSGQINGNLNLLRLGSAALTLNSAQGYNGTTNISDGVLTLQDNATLLNTTAISINAGTLALNNNANQQTQINDRINNSAPITLRAGTITYTGRVAASASETFGALTAAQGANVITATANVGSGAFGSVDLNFPSLTRQPNTTINFTGTNLGQQGNNSRIVFNAPLTTVLGGALGSWAIANSSDYAAYNAGSGIGIVGTGGYVGYDGTFGLGLITQIPALVATTTTLSGNTTTGLLRIAGGVTNDIAFTNATDVLNLEQGGLLRSDNNNATTIGTTSIRGHLTAGGTETSGTRELVVYNNQNTVTINSIIENNGFGNQVALVKSGAGTVLLTGTNTYTGGTSIIQGNLNTNGLAALGTGPISMNGGTLGLLWDGTAANNGATPESLVLNFTANPMTIEGNGGLTVGRLAQTFAPYNLLAVNKTIEITAGLTFTSPALGNSAFTINNNNGYGVNISQTVAMPTSGGTLNFNVATASASSVVQGLTLSGAVTGGLTGSGVPTLVKSGAGTLVLSNAGNTFGGGGSMIDILGGYLSVGADAHLGDASNFIRLSTGSATQGLRATGTFATTRQLVLNGATSGIEVTEGNTLTLSSAFNFTAATNGLAKNDLGTLVLTQAQTLAGGAAATWDGVLTINQGAVRVTNSAALGSAVGNTVLAGVVGSAVELAGGVTVAEPLAINPGNNNTNRGILGQGAVRSVSGNNTWAGAITLAPTTADNQNRAASIKADAGATLNLTGGLIGGLGTGGTARDSWFAIGGDGTVNLTTMGMTHTGTVGVYSLVKVGSGTMNIQVASAMSGQQVIVKQGTLSLNGAGTLGVPTLGAPGTVFVNPTANLVLDNSGTNVDNRLGARNFDLRGGNMSILGNSGVATNENFGTLTLNYGAGVITLNPDAANPLSVSHGAVTRNAGSTLLIRGTNLGSAPGAGTATIAGSGTAYAFIGQLGGDTQTFKSILPYAIGDTTISGLGAGFLTATSAQGGLNSGAFRLRLLDPAEQVTSLLAPLVANTAENVSLSSVVNMAGNYFAGNPFLANSLQLNSGGQLDMAGMRTFTLDSGGILAFTGNLGITNPAALLSTTANRELIVHALGDLTIASNIIGSTGGLTKSGAGTLELTSAFHTFTGTTHVNQGVLKLSGGDHTLFPNQAVHLMGGSLDLNGSVLNANLLRADVQALGRNDGHAMIGGAVINTSGSEAVLALTTGNVTFSGTVGNNVPAESAIAVVRSTAAGSTNDWNLWSNNTYTGATLINGGRIQVLDAGRLSGTSAIEISNATLLLAGSNTSVEGVEISNRVNDSAPITLRGGMFQGRGYAAQTYTETLGALTLAGAGNYIDIAEPGTNLNSIDYTFASLTQAAGSRATVRFMNVDGAIGSLARTYFTSAPALTNNIIGGWAVFEREFASYSSTFGVGGLNTNGFIGYSPALINDALATDNVRIVTPAGGSTTTLTANRTVNSLNMQATGTATANSILNLGGNTLTVASGGVILAPNTDGFGYTVQNGNLTAGTTGVGGDLYVHGLTFGNGDADNTGNRDITLAASVVDNAGGPVSLVIAGSMGRGTGFNLADIFVTGSNTHTGGTWINSGRVTLNNPAANGTSITAIPGNLTIAGGYGANAGSFEQRNSFVILGAANQIANTAVATIRGGGALDLAGFNQTLAGINFENTGGTTPVLSIGTGTLTLNGNITASGNNLGSVSTISTTGIGELSLGGATRTITVDPVQWQTRNLNPYLPNLNITSVVSGTGAEGITKAGTGILQLSGQSTFSGGVALNAGGLMVGGSSTPSAPGSTVTAGPLGTGTLTIGAGTFLTSSAANNAVANNYVIGGNFSFTGINSLFLNGNTTLPAGATTINVQDPTAVPNAGALVLGGVISGTDPSSSIIKTGLGTLALNNNNTFLGGVTLNAGNLVIGGAPASNNASPTPTVLVNSADAVLSLMNNGAGSGGVISYSSVIDIANTLSSANLHVGNFSANTANVIEVGNLNLANTTTLNVSSSNLYSLRLLNLNTTGGPANINVAAGTTVLVFNYGANQPVNVGPGQLLFPFQPNINSLTNTDSLTPGLPSLSGTYPLVPQFAPLGVTTPAGYSSGGLSSSHYSYGSAQNTISVGSSGTAPTAQRTSTSLLGNVAFVDRPVGVSPANNTNSSSVYTGLIEITTGGTYTFKTAVDDQSLLIIDGVTVSGVNAAGGGAGLSDYNAASAATGTITLTPGFHTITYKNTNQGSGGGFHLLYSGPDTAGNGLVGGFQAISPTKLYFNNGPASLANGFLLAAGLTNDYTVSFGTTATIDTFGTQFNVVMNTLSLDPLSQLRVVNGAGSLGTNFIGVRGVTTISGSDAIINTGGTATSGAAILNLIGGVDDGGNGFKKFGAGTLVLGQSSTFSGTLDVLAGTVQLTDAAGLSSGTNNIGSATTALATGGTTNGSQIVTLSSTAGLVPGQIINGAGIVPGSYIVSVDSATQLTISNTATATASNIVVNIGGASLDLNGVTGVTGNVNIAGLGQNIMVATSIAPVPSAFTAALWNSSSAPASIDGTVTVGSPLTSIGGYGDITLNGAITAAVSSSIYLTGQATKTINADNSATLLSPIFLMGGTLMLGHTNALGDAISGTSVPVVSLSNATTNATTTVTVTSTAGLIPGMLVTGTNIPANATIASITNATSFVLSAAATGSGTVNLTAAAHTTTSVIDLNGMTTSEPFGLANAGFIGSGATATNGATYSSLATLVNTNAALATVNGAVTLFNNTSIGSSRVNALSGATGGDIAITGPISGAFLLTKVGSNTLTLSGANTQNGLTITQGTVNVTGLAGTAGSGGNLTVNASTIAGLTFGSRLVFDNTTDASSTRAGGAAANRTITLAGGEFSILGNGSTAVSESIGTGNLALSSMFNLVTLTNAGANVQLSTTGAGTITRANQATALIRGTLLGSAAPGAGTTNIMLGTAPAFTGNASTTGTNMRIIPWIVADASAAGDGSGASAQFATWDATAGIRPLVAATETTNVFTVDTNVRADSALDAGAAVTGYTTTRLNSLTIESGGSLSIAALRNVTLQSGGILAKTSATISGPGSLSADANANLIIHTQGAGTVLTLNAALGGLVGSTTGGLAKSGEGTLVLNGQNNYLGETRLNGGTLQIGAAAPATNALFYRWTTAPAINATASTLNSDLIVSQAGSTLDLNGHNQSSGRLASSIATPGAGGIVTSGTAATLHTVVAADSTFSGQMTGLLSFARSGGFSQAFTSDNSYTGSTTLYGGVTTLVDQGTLSGTSAISINRSGLRWDDSGLQALSGRLASTIDLSLTAGGFEFRSRSGLASSISIDDVTLNSGASYLLINVGNAGVGSATMNIDTLIRATGTGATVTFAAANGAAGDNPFFKLGTAPTLVNGIIGPWATTFSSVNPATGTANGAFATYDPVVGIRPMSAYYEKATFATATATDNLRFGDISPVVPDGGTAANTLVWNGLTAARTMTFGNATDTLTLTAGGLITGNENFAKTIGSTTLRGKLTTSASEFFIYNTVNTLTIHSEITGNFDLILGSMSQTANTPTISLTAPNTYVGNTFVNGVVVTLNNTTGSGDAITGNLTIAGGTNAGGDSAPIANTAVRLLASNQIADSASVTVRGGSQLDLNGFSDTVTSLTLLNDGGSNGNQGPLVQTGAGTLTISSGNITAAVQGQMSTIPVIAGNVVLGSPATVDVGLVAGSEMLVNGMTNSQIGLALNANVKGATTLGKTGAGVLHIGGVSDSVTQINVSAGAVTLGAASNYRNASLDLSAGTILDMRGATNTAIGTITGSGVIKNFNPTAGGTLVTGNSANGTFSGQIMSDYTSGLLSVTKIGTGLWTLTGDNDGNLLNTLQINGGEVKVEGANGSLGFVTTILGEGGTLTLNNATDALGNRLGGTTSIGSTTANRALSMRGGLLNYIGGTTAIAEDLNTVTLLEGASRWNLTSSGSQTLINIATLSASSTTNRGSLVLNAGSLLLGTTAPGATAVNVISAAPNLVGGIRPDIIGIDSTGTGFVTHDANGFRLLNATETQVLGTGTAGTGSVLPAVVTSASANIELASTTGLVVGQTVTGAGIPAGTTIQAIVDATNITLSQPATATADTRLTFGVTDTANAIANGSATLMQFDTVNSLTLNGGLAGSGGGITNSTAGQAWSLACEPVVLNVTSGGVLANAGNTGITGIGLTSGAALLQLHTLGDLALNASILGSGGVQKDGAGILTLNARSYNTGAFVQNEGTTRLAAGTNTLLVVPNATVATLTDLVVNGGTFDLNGNSQAVRQFSTASSGFAGSLVNTSATAVSFYTAPNANVTFSGTLGGTGGNNFNFIKSGNSNLTLQQAATHTGVTAVRGGTLILTDNAAITGGGAVNVNYATLSLVNNGLAHIAARTGNSVLTFNGGALSITPRLEGEASVTTGTVSLANGRNTVTFAAQPGVGGSFNLNSTSLSRSAGATLLIPAVGTGQLGRGSAANAEQSPQWTLTTAPTVTNNIVGGWAVYNGTDFLTYLSTPSSTGAQGFGVLGDTNSGFANYNTNDTDGGDLPATAANNNVRLSGNFNYQVNGDRSFNAVAWAPTTAGNNLVFNAAATTLTLTSGGLIRSGNITSSIGQSLDWGRITNGTEIFLFNNQNTLTINSRLTGAARATFSSGTGGSTFVLANGTSRSTVGATTTASSATVVPASFASLYVGQAVSGPGIPANTTITAINGTTDITLSAPATASGTIAGGNFLTFGTTAGTVTQNTTTTNASTSVTLQAANANLYVGMPVYGTGIAAGTTITAISGTSVTLSAAATANGTNVALVYGTAGNNYSGGTTVNNGTTLQLVPVATNQTVIPAGGLVINGGAVNFGASTTNFGLIAAANAVTINGGGSLTFPNYTGGVAYTNTLASLTISDNGGTTATTVALGTPGASNTTHKLVLTGATPISSTNDNHATTPIISGGFTSSTQFSSIEFSNAAPTITVAGVAPQGLIISAPITQNAGMTGVLTKGGAGTLILTSPESTFSTGFTLSAGGVILGADSTGVGAGVTKGPLGTGTVTLGNNTILLADGTARTLGNNVTVNGNITFGGTDAGHNLTLAGDVNLGAAARTLTVTSPQVTTTINGVVTGTAGGLVKSGDGVLLLNAANTFGGGLTINGGVVRAGNASAIPTAQPLTVNMGGALDLNGNSLTVSSLASNSATTGGLITSATTSGIVTLTVGDATNTNFGGAITNNVGSTLHFAKQGAGTLTLGGPNSYSGTTTIVEGGITLAANNVLPDTTLVTVAPLSGSSTVDLAGFSDTIAALTFSGAGATTANVTTGTGTLTVYDAITYDATNNPNGATISGNLNLGGDQKDITVGDSTAATVDLTISATITDSFPTDGITKNGLGTLALTAVGSTYSGPTIINGGTVQVVKLSDGGVASSIGDTPVAAANLVINGATLAYLGSGDSTNREMTIGTGGATLDSSGTGAVNFTATAPLALTGTDTARTLNLVGSNTGTNTLAPQITDNGTGATTVVKDGAGLWALAGNNTYTGPTNVNNGTFLANNTPVGLADSATGTGSVTVALGATLGGTGSIVAGAGNDITIAGTLTPGTPGVSVGNDLVIRTSGATGDITLSNTTNINIFNNVVGSNPLASNNRVVFGADDWANIIFGGSSVLNINDTTGNSGTTWTTGDSWQIFDWTGIAGSPPVTGFATVNLPTLSGALVWDTSALYTSGIIAIGVPEPSRLLLLMLGLFGFLSRRRRK